MVNNNNVQCFFGLYTKRKGQTSIQNLVLKDSLKKSVVLKDIRKKYKKYLNFIEMLEWFDYQKIDKQFNNLIKKGIYKRRKHIFLKSNHI